MADDTSLHTLTQTDHYYYYHIAYNHPRYFVYKDGAVLYEGSYTQCLVVVGAFHLYPGITIDEIRAKTDGFV